MSTTPTSKVKCPNCMGVGFFGLGSDCRDCGGTGERTFASLRKEEQEYLTEPKKVIDNLKIT